MPWESTSRPSLAIGILTALASAAGFECVGVHLNLRLSALIGEEVYNAFAENIDLFPPAEHFFAVDIFGPDALNSETYLAKLGGHPTAEGADPDPLHELRDGAIPWFLSQASDAITEQRPDVVGFTCTFNQVLPSLALARRLKLELPEVTILLGGASVHGQMGIAYAEAFPELVDHVFTGEADQAFVAWLQAYAAGDPRRPLAGVTGGRSYRAGTPFLHLDRLPIPDYASFFCERAALADAGADLPYVRHLPYESSRGCWWGEKHHCTFCGLNNEGMEFRRKSASRVVAELEELAQRHAMTSFMASDNILDFRAYRGLLSELERSSIDFDLFYEIKANVDRDDIASLRRAGVWRVQPGIESFSDHVLTLMRKGTTGVQNAQLLKWLQEYGVQVDYNILIGFPGETEDDYRDLIRICKALAHLAPPNGAAINVRVDRFSPFFDDSAGLGIRGLRAADYYRHLIPTSLIEPERYAYFFDRNQVELEQFADAIEELNATLRRWKERSVRKVARLGNGFIDLLTSVDGRMRRTSLRGLKALIFVVADGHTSLARLERDLGEEHADNVRTCVNELVADGALLDAGGRVVSVVPYAEPRSRALLAAWAERYSPAPDRELSVL